MVADQINKAGGIKGEKLQLIVYDDEGDATKANLYVKKLITQDKVCAVIGPSLSGLSLAVIPLAERYETPLVSCAASYRIVYNKKTGKPYRWVFKTPQTDTMAAEAIYTHLKNRGIDKKGSDSFSFWKYSLCHFEFFWNGKLGYKRSKKA